jgi:hypothetical protein
MAIAALGAQLGGVKRMVVSSLQRTEKAVEGDFPLQSSEQFWSALEACLKEDKLPCSGLHRRHVKTPLRPHPFLDGLRGIHRTETQTAQHGSNTL